MDKVKVAGCLAAILLLTVIMAGCGSKEPEVNEPQYTTVPVERGDVVCILYVPGELVLTDTLALSSPLDSELLDLLVKPGEQVKKGDILAHLDASEWEEQLAAKELDLIQAEINLKQTKIALDKAKNPYTEEEIEAAKKAVKDAKNQLDKVEGWLADAIKSGSSGEVRQLQMEVFAAETNLKAAKDRLHTMLYERDEDDIEIKEMQVKIAEGRLKNATKAVEEALAANPEIIAPCDGMVLDIKFRAGDIVTRDSPIIVLADLRQMELRVTIGQDNIISIKRGMSAEISLDALLGTALEGKVDYMLPQKSPTSQTVTYEVYLSLNEVAEGLLPGMTGGATILVAEKHDVLRLPRRLVKIAPDGSGRVEVLEQGQPVFKEVVIGVRGDSYYEIVSGLSEGDLAIQRGRF